MAPKHGKGIVDEKGRSLWISFGGEYEWNIRICRTEREEDDRFSSLNMKEVTPDQIREFLPNWERRDWKRGGVGRSKAKYIQDGNYKLYLVCDNASIGLDKVMEEFKCFMGV